MNSTADLWYVKLPDGDVHCVTVDQLDEAFQRGAIDRRARVFAQDQRTWISLGEILGEDEMEARSPVAAYGAPSSYAPRSHTPARYGPRDDAPGPAYGSAYAAVMPSSVRPVSMDFEAEDIDLSPYKSGSGKWIFAAIVIFAGVGVAVGYSRPDIQVAAVAQVHARMPAIASTISRLQSSLGKLTGGREQAAQSSSSVHAPQADVAPPPALPAVAAAAAPAVQPAAAPAQPSATAATDGPPAVAAASPPAAPQHDAVPKGATAPRKPSVYPHPKAAGRAAGTGGSQRPKSNGTQPFTTGGNKFDPLNSSI
jgi:hypothetical protein